MAMVVILSLFSLFVCAVEYSSKANNGLKSVMYYGDWSVWEGDDMFYPAHLPADQLTHLNFAFLDLDANGNLVLTDVDADYGHDFDNPNVEWGAANGGLFPAFQDLRGKYPNLRIGVSIGGWSKSGDFTGVAKDPTKRANFVSNVAKFVEYNNLDFVDIDWEYPGYVRPADLVDNKNDEGTPYSTPEDGKYFIALLQDLKAMENDLSKKNNRVYELSVALPAGPPKWVFGAQAYLPPGVTLDTATAEQIQEAETTYVTLMFATIDFGNIMTYDLRGAWDETAGHHTNLYAHPSVNSVAEEVDFSADAIVSFLLGRKTDSRGNALPRYIVQGVDPAKLVLGVAFYTRGWEQVDNNGDDPVKYPGLYGTAHAVDKDADGTIGYGAKNYLPVTSGDGGRNDGSWPFGTVTKLRQAYPALTYYYDDVAEAPYLYDPVGGAFFTYDSPRSIAAKADYVKEMGLGGIITWMASNDAETGGEDSGAYTAGHVRSVLTTAIRQGLWGTTALDQFNVGAPALNVSATVTIGSDWDGNKVFQINLKNNFVNRESNEALRLAATAGGTVTAPKLYITVRDGVNIGSGEEYGSGTWTQTGNLVIDDLSTTWELETLDPGESAQIQLPAKSGNIAVADIVQIEISKQIYMGGKEVGRALIYPAK